MTLEEIVVELRAEIELINRALNDLRLLTGRRATVSGEPQSSLSSSQDIGRHRREEYNFLRTEIEAIWSQTYKTLNFLLAFIGLIVAGAYSKDLETYRRIVVFVMASLITVGGYQLVHVHTARIWRITTYMRCALEPNLSGIAWESRLAARSRANKRGMYNDAIGQSLFHGHILILDVINVGLFLEIAYEFYGTLSRIGSGTIVCGLALLLPMFCAWRSLSVRSETKRGGKLEVNQLQLWQNKLDGKPVFANTPKIPPPPDDTLVP